MSWRVVLAEVVRDRWPDLVGYASLYARDRAGAEDLVQEALVRVFSRTRSLPSAPAAEQYVRRAIRTSFLDGARKERTWRGTQHMFVSTDSSRGPELAVQAQVDVRAALAGLSARQRACVVLRYVDDLPVAEIADDLGLSEGAVKRYLSDGTARLRVALGEAGSIDDIPVVALATDPRSMR